MSACQCERPRLARFARFGRFGRRSFREEDGAISAPAEETIESFEVPSPPMEAFGGDGFKQVVKTAFVFWAVTRILDRVFLGR